MNVKTNRNTHYGRGDKVHINLPAADTRDAAAFDAYVAEAVYHDVNGRLSHLNVVARKRDVGDPDQYLYVEARYVA